MTKKQIIGGAVVTLLTSVGLSVFLSTWLFAQTLDDWADTMDARVQALVQAIPKVINATTTPIVTQPPIITIGESRINTDQSTQLAARPSPVARLMKKNGLELGHAIALTTDGWFVTTQSAWNEGIVINEVQLMMAKKISVVEKAVRDTSTDLVYIKTTARDLPVAAISNELGTMGETVFLNPANRWYVEAVAAPAVFASGTKATETATRRLLVSGEESAAWKGAAVWDEEGKLLGLLQEHTREGWKVIPARFIVTGFSELLSRNVIKRATLSATVSVDEFGTQTIKKPTKVLLEGDLLQKIDRDLFDGKKDIGEQLLDYRPSSTVSIFGLRNNKEFTVDVTLGSVTTSEMIK